MASRDQPSHAGRSASTPTEGYVDTPIRQRAGLHVGEMVPGPVVIEEYGSTIPIHPGFTVDVDAWRNLVVTRIEDGDL